MTVDVIQTSGLTKNYADRAAVKGLNLSVRRGEVYGFLGPNGAGKTTTLCMLLGLVRPSAGTAMVLDEAPGSPAGLARVGALVEAPGFYPYLSGRRNLAVLAGYSGVPGHRVDEVLEQVGLSDRAADKVKGYSLGMKQRLGVAAALLKDPDLLILDEPTNGLDPQGMAEMRTLIRELGSGARTVFLSSHLLGEIQQICDRVGVIQQGTLVAEGTVSELRGSAGLLVHADPLDEARRIVEEAWGKERVEVLDGALTVQVDPERAVEITHDLVHAGVGVREIRPLERSLEEAFLQLTREGDE